MNARELDRAIEALARRQHGAFSRTQARALGASSSAIDRRISSGAWLRLAPGIYALPANPPSFERQCMAAVLASPGGAISGRAAAVLHGVDGFTAARLQVTVPSGGHHENPFANVRRSDDFESTTRRHIEVATFEQTICDLTGVLDAHRLAEVIDLALSTRATTVDRLVGRFERLRPRSRSRLQPLGRILDTRRSDAYVPPATALEAALYRALDDPRIPAYERQPRFPWRPDSPQRPDALISSWQLIVEADGRAWHTRVDDFARDRRRDREALEHGFCVVRYTYEELTSAPGPVVENLRRIGARVA